MEAENNVFNAVTGENERTMVLSENEVKVVESIRKGAQVELAFYNGLNKEEAFKEVEKYGKVKREKTNDIAVLGMYEWYANPVSQKIRAIAFFE